MEFHKVYCQIYHPFENLICNLSKYQLTFKTKIYSIIHQHVLTTNYNILISHRFEVVSVCVLIISFLFVAERINCNKLLIAHEE